MRLERKVFGEVSADLRNLFHPEDVVEGHDVDVRRSAPHGVDRHSVAPSGRGQRQTLGVSVQTVYH